MGVKKQLWKSISVLETPENNYTKWKIRSPCRPTKVIKNERLLHLCANHFLDILCKVKRMPYEDATSIHLPFCPSSGISIQMICWIS